MRELFHLFHSDTSILTALGYSLFGMAIVFLMLCLLMLVIHLMHAALSRKKEQAAPVPQPEPAPLAPGSAGGVALHGVPERTAAMLMAIVAEELGKPLNELRFVSIREVEESK